jgi:F420-dependent oxidoreductase-like protein
MTERMRFGVFVPQGWKLDLTEIDEPVAQYDAMTAVAKAADAEPAYDSIWLYDHFHTVPTPELETTFECWTATATLARDTERVKIGQMVGCNGYRNPALYAKIASTVDVASHHRLYAGIGAGWYEQEWKAYGYEWTDTPTRMRRFREAVQIIHQMWTEDYPEFTGQHYTIDRPINEPKDAGQGKIPLWIGGGGEQVTLKLVARYADACNVGGGDVEVIRHKLEVLKRHCDAVGRDYDQITKSTSIEPLVIVEKESDLEKATAPLRGDMSLEEYRQRELVGTPDQLTERIEAIAEAGIDYLIVYLPRIAYDHTPLHLFAGQVIPHFTNLSG